MRVRHGFVSNSSSSSFILPRSMVTPEQVQQIIDHSEVGKKLGLDYAEDAWSIEVTDTEVRGWTTMDNFNMHEFFERIGVGSKCPHCGHTSGTVRWEDGHFWDAPWADPEDDV
jgi:hypothetical protein